MDDNNKIPFIDEIVEDYNKVQEKVLEDEPSAAQSLSVNLTKILILTCASYYEQQLIEAYEKYARKESDRYGDRPHGFDNDQRNKSIYSKFDFGRIEGPEDYNQLPGTRQMLKPLGVFGAKFQDRIYNDIDGDSEKEQQLRDFQELFALRNLLAHQAFVEFSCNKIRGKSFSDILHMHENAIKFVTYLKEKFC